MVEEKLSSRYFKKGYVLVVDDVPNMRKTIRNMLRQLGTTDIKEADDGDTAIKLLGTSSETCKFVLLDWNMPRMPGIHVAREIRADEAYQNLPILMITAETYQDQIAHAGEIGINGYIIKPFNAKILNDRILTIMEARTNPPEHVKLIKAGETFVMQGKYDIAIEMFEESRSLSESARVLVHIGQAAEKKGDLKTAAENYGKAQEINPKYLKAYIVAADLNMKMGNEKAAMEALEKASEISPNNTDRQMNLGKIYLKNGDSEKADKAFSKAVEREPEQSREVAENYLNSNNGELAEKYFRKSLHSRSDDVHVYNRLGIALRKQGKWEEAITEYQKALKIDPDDEAIHFNMSRAYLEGKRNSLARGCFQKVLKINPDLSEAEAELKRCC